MEPITLRHEDTEQECTFPDRAAAESFTQNVADADAWKLVFPAAEQPAGGTHIDVDLAQLRADVASETAE
jgi:hypothetical protein